MKTLHLKSWGLVCLTLAATIVCSDAGASTKTGTFNVTATIASDCQLTATDVLFGTYSSLTATTDDVTSTVDVYCTVGTTYTVALNVGTGGGTFASRLMVSGANTLPYNLYTTAARTTIWGDGTLSTATASGTGVGELVANPLTVYGRIAVGLDRAPGSYASVVTVTVTF